MSDRPDSADDQELEQTSEFLEERVDPALGEVFDAYVLVGISTTGQAQLFFNEGENARYRDAIRPLLASAIAHVEAYRNSSQQEERN